MERALLAFGLLTCWLFTNALFAASPAEGSSSNKNDAGKNASSDKFKIRARLTADHLALSSQRVRCTLEPVSEKNEKPAAFSSVVETLAPGKKLYVILKDFRTNTQPGVLYTAYLNLPEKATPAETREHVIGVINFFNATISPDPAHASSSNRFVSFDITNLAKKLLASGRLKDNAMVTLVPRGVPDDDAKPIIGEVTIVEQ
jgi:hypothetical protein